MFTKSLISMIILMLSFNLSAKTKVVKIDGNEEGFNKKYSLSGNFNHDNMSEITSKVYKQLATDKVIQEIKKKRGLSIPILQFEKFKNRTNSHISVNLLKSMITRELVMNRKFSVIASKKVIKKLREERTEQIKKSGIKPDFIFTGILKDGKKEIKGETKSVEYIFEYKLTDNENKVVYKNKVIVKNIVRRIKTKKIEKTK